MRLVENFQERGLTLGAVGELVLVLVVVVAGAFAAPPEPSSGATISLGTYLGGLPSLSATIGGRTGLFLFDTGGGNTVVSPAMAAASGCSPWGNITGFRMRGDRVDFPRCDNLRFSLAAETLVAPTAGVFDIMSLAGPKAPHLDGSIALDAFSRKRLTLDLGHHQLRVESPEAFLRQVRGTRVPVRVARDRSLGLEIYLGVATPAGKAWMEMDSGNDSSEIMVSKSMAPQFGLDPKIRGPQPFQAIIPPGIRLEGKARVVENMIMDGNIGMTFLKNWVLMLDLENGRAWIRPAR